MAYPFDPVTASHVSEFLPVGVAFRWLAATRGSGSHGVNAVPGAPVSRNVTDPAGLSVPLKVGMIT